LQVALMFGQKSSDIYTYLWYLYQAWLLLWRHSFPQIQASSFTDWEHH